MNENAAELEGLLKKQIALAKRGSLSGLEKLAVQSERLVEKIKAAGLPEKSELGTRRLLKLYQELQLLLSTQKDDAIEQLKSIRKGKKTLAVYRGSV
jgi:hypothetical protein